MFHGWFLDSMLAKVSISRAVQPCWIKGMYKYYTWIRFDRFPISHQIEHSFHSRSWIPRIIPGQILNQAAQDVMKIFFTSFTSRRPTAGFPSGRHRRVFGKFLAQTTKWFDVVADEFESGLDSGRRYFALLWLLWRGGSSRFWLASSFTCWKTADRFTLQWRKSFEDFCQ